MLSHNCLTIKGNAEKKKKNKKLLKTILKKKKEIMKLQIQESSLIRLQESIPIEGARAQNPMLVIWVQKTLTVPP